MTVPYKLQSEDTTPEIESKVFSLWRETPMDERLRQVASLIQTTREFSKIGIRRRFPHADESEIQWRLAAMLYGEELTRQAYGDCAGYSG